MSATNTPCVGDHTPFVLEGMVLGIFLERNARAIQEQKERDKNLYKIDNYLINLGIKILKSGSEGQFFDFYRRLHMNNKKDILRQINLSEDLNDKDMDLLEVTIQKMISYERNIKQIRKYEFF